ncbi:MAG: hypothetical protein SFU84_06275 [Gemmatimonadales bacterium]|nr:hypothetical protein [Gemmatimonadales bacterium]
MTHPAITLLPQQHGSDLPHIALRALRHHLPTIACDCYVEAIEHHGSPVEWGWRYGPHENIDHHAPVDAMARLVSSANLALVRVARLGTASPDTRVLLTHTDCDSILSAGIVSGRIPPLLHYGDAALAADHTGADHPVADLLQAIQDRRDVEYAFEMLACLEGGRPLPPDAARLLDARRRKRDDAASAVAQGRFEQLGEGIWFAGFSGETDGEFFPALLPEAQLIVVGVRHPDPARANPWAIKVRRGLGMPDGRDLRHLELTRYDQAYGGRWNAGSNKRGGGTGLEPRVWAEGLRRRVSS